MPEYSSRDYEGLTLRDIGRGVWRWKWLVVAITCSSALVAYVYSSQQAPQYMATAQLVYVQPVDPTNPLTPAYTSNAQDLAIETAVNVVEAPVIVDNARSILGGLRSSGYRVSAITSGATSTNLTGSVIKLSATGANPNDAAAVANAYAQAMVDWRKAQQLDRLKVAEQAVQARLNTFTSATSKRTSDYTLLQQNLQNLRLLEPTVTADLQIIAPATAPAESFTPKPRRSAAEGLGVGLFASVVLALVVSQLASKVQSQREAGESLGLPIIGAVPEIPRRSWDNGRPVVLTHPDGRAAEALRLVRSNLDYLNADDVSSLLVTSATAGEGKTMMVCNLAVTMAMAGKKIVVVDGNLRRPRVHEYLNVSNDVGLSSVAAGTVSIGDALRAVDLPATLRGSRNGDGSVRDESVRVTSDRRLVVLTAGPRVADPGELVASKQFGTIIRGLTATKVDFVIVDSPALLEVGDAATMASQVEGLIVVASLVRARRSTLREAQDVLAPLPCRKLGVVLVRARQERSH
jgi:polysaccharide biosynthesis transport protein